jgi:glycosyltransferase involved in cell wall biosynthesis
MTKIAYFCEPQIGGTFSFFRRMRPLLLERGIDFRCVPPVTAERLSGTAWAELDGIDAVSFPEEDLPVATELLIQHLEQSGYDAVMVLPGTNVLSTNLVRYLPRSIRAVARVPMITRGAYAPTQSVCEHLNRIFAVSHRVQDDLVKRYGVPEDGISVIYNGVDIPGISAERSFGRNGEPFRLLYSGRLWDIDKGVMLLPEILERVRRREVDAQLMIVGSGADEGRMRAEFTRRGVLDRVEWTGDVALGDVSKLLHRADCFLLPSRFEGCPNALIEAMAHGCPSVAARIRGSVDRIVEDGVSGLLADVASPESFANRIDSLAVDANGCEAMGNAARQRVVALFSAERTADEYARMLRDSTQEEDGRAERLSVDQYQIPRAMQPTWRTRIPVPIKNWARKWLERY